MMYILSDDDFFSLGVRSVFRKAGEEVSVLLFDRDSWRTQVSKIDDGDILLLAVDFIDVVNEILQGVSGKDIKICLFINSASGYDSFTGAQGIVSRGIPLNLIVWAVNRAVRKNALRRITERLTPAERVVMDQLATGLTVSQVATCLNVGEKTVYSHKRRATERMGINKLKARSVLIYDCVKHLFSHPAVDDCVKV
ncbi:MULTISPECIES: LuxR C-terminal-related transcriptional regulator [Raoultella]|uniref:helix-turn-helix transcriptional regulator n=1 Tax=Raoultella TaxID=160674 RepID=UPI00216A6DE6|nr:MULTISPECIES: LuxR C-terminal-related transcriptional regulator [Raoultella]MCS4270055.1 DNA-binding CsgD family transcriptional regulator [Raoultella sp. BIGb0132]MCS4287015.1 DNA-binding CsgD family transcriptional regulator [Raoultella terrigena]